MFSFGETPVTNMSPSFFQQSGSKNYSLNQGNIFQNSYSTIQQQQQKPKKGKKIGVTTARKKVSFLKSNPIFVEDRKNQIRNTAFSPLQVQIIEDEKINQELRLKSTPAISILEVSFKELFQKGDQRKRSQSLNFEDREQTLKFQMEKRLSGYDYNLSPRSSVSYQSFDSFIDYSKIRSNSEVFQIQKQDKDKIAEYRRKILLLKAMQGFKIYLIKQKTLNKLKRPPIKSHKAFYVVALIKSQFHSLNNYIKLQHEPDIQDNPVYQEKKLWILKKSLFNFYHKVQKMKQQETFLSTSQIQKLNDYLLIFDRQLRLKKQVYQKLKKFSIISKKKKLLNFKAMQLWLRKFQSVSLYHWHNLFKHRKRRNKMLKRKINKLFHKRMREAFQRLQILMSSKKIYHNFILERENFLFNLKDHDFHIGTRKMEILLESQLSKNLSLTNRSIDKQDSQNDKQQHPILSKETSEAKSFNKYLKIDVQDDDEDAYQSNRFNPGLNEYTLKIAPQSSKSRNQNPIQTFKLPSPISKTSMGSPTGFMNNTTSTFIFNERTLMSSSLSMSSNSAKNAKKAVQRSALSSKNTSRLGISSPNTTVHSKIQPKKSQSSIKDIKIQELNAKIRQELAQKRLEMLKQRNSQVPRLFTLQQNQNTSGSNSQYDSVTLHKKLKPHPSNSAQQSRLY